MRTKKLIMLAILCLISTLCTTIAFAAPVYIDSLADFPGYPYNTGTYWVPVDGYVGCGPTTGAMILGYFEHHFGATGLLTNPVAGVDEGLDTAWELHNYMMTGADGFGAPANVKPGMEDYAEDRGYEIKVMVHYEIGKNPADVPAAYGAYGEGWIDDVDFWVDLGGGVWDIDPDKFCDFVGSKLATGIGIWLSVDPGLNWDGQDPGLGSADHWVPCVGVDKDADIYYYYDTWTTTMHSEDIIAVGAPGAGAWAIGFIRSVTYVGPVAPMTIESCDSTGAKKDTFQLSDEVYATGTGYSISTTYDVYLVEDVTWVDGMAIPAQVPGTTTSISSDATGNVPATLLWSAPLVPGKYDIVVDIDGDGLYSAQTDALDDNDIQVTAGFFVIPEFWLGTILGLAGCFAAFGLFHVFKRKPQ